MTTEGAKRPTENDVNFSVDTNRLVLSNPLPAGENSQLTISQQEVYVKHALPDESFPDMLVRIRSEHTRREMTELIGQGQKRLKRWFSEFGIKAALSDEENKRRGKEVGRRRTLRHLEQVAGENYAEKIDNMVNGLNFTNRQIARELDVCVAGLKHIFQLLDINKAPREAKTELVSEQIEFKEPEINTQNSPIINAVHKVIEKQNDFLLSRKIAARLLVLYPYKGEQPSLRTIGKMFGVSGAAIESSTKLALRRLKKAGLL